MTFSSQPIRLWAAAISGRRSISSAAAMNRARR
jgi:hypothetical protein